MGYYIKVTRVVLNRNTPGPAKISGSDIAEYKTKSEAVTYIA